MINRVYLCPQGGEQLVLHISDIGDLLNLLVVEDYESFLFILRKQFFEKAGIAAEDDGLFNGRSEVRHIPNIHV